MSGLKALKEWEEIYFVVDLLASEYGWTINYIQELTVSEIYGLIYSILKRRGYKVDQDKPSKSQHQDPMTNLLNLARQLKASPEQMKSLKGGKGITL